MGNFAHAALYLPGVGPETYENGEDVSLYVNKITSTRTQIPYDYYSMPYCKPKKKGKVSENVGEVLEGNRIELSVYDLEFRKDRSCALACIKKLSSKDRKKFRDAIEDKYYVHWILDQLPVGHRLADKTGTVLNGYEFIRGFPVGFTESFTDKDRGGKKRSRKAYLNNHIRITVSYNEHDEDEDLLTMDNTGHGKIVGFRVDPMSIDHKWTESNENPRFSTCGSTSVANPSHYLSLDDLGSGEDVAFT